MAARSAIALARSGATTGLSDGRKLTGPEAVLHWQHKLRSLEAGSSLPAGSVSVASASNGYVNGQTTAGFIGYGAARATSVTYGSGADYVFSEGDLSVFLSSTLGGVSKTAYTLYTGFGLGDEVWASGQLDWDYNWQGNGGNAFTRHVANYGDHEAETASGAGF